MSAANDSTPPSRKGLTEARLAAMALVFFTLVVAAMLGWMFFVAPTKAVEHHRRLLLEGEAAKVVMQLDEVLRDGELPEELAAVYQLAKSLNSAQALEHTGQFEAAQQVMAEGFAEAEAFGGVPAALLKRLEVTAQAEGLLAEPSVPDLATVEELYGRSQRVLGNTLTQVMRDLYLRLLEEALRGIDSSRHEAERQRLIGQWPELTYNRSSG